MKSAEEWAKKAERQARYYNPEGAQRMIAGYIRAAQAEAFAAGAEAMRKEAAYVSERLSLAASSCPEPISAVRAGAFHACQQAILSLPAPKMEETK